MKERLSDEEVEACQSLTLEEDFRIGFASRGLCEVFPSVQMHSHR